MEKHIYEKASDFAKYFNELDAIMICKSNQNNWSKESIEITTDYMPDYIAFKINLDLEQDDESGKVLTGSIAEIWFWDEEYCPTPVVYPDFSEWTIGTRVVINFNESDDESDGQMEKN